LSTVREILANPVYTGHVIWGRAGSRYELADPDNAGLGKRRARARADPGSWSTSAGPVHPALVSAIDHLRANALVLRYDPRTRTLEASGKHPVRITI